jgi:hypothetical protein
MALTAPVTDGLTRWLENEAPAAVAGSGGHDATFTVACGLWRMLNDESAVWARLQEYNTTRCSPPWSERDLRHKLEEGDKATAGDPKRLSRSRNAPGMTRKARGSSPGDIRAALAAPPRKYATAGRPALPRPAPRPPEPTTRAKHENPAALQHAENAPTDRPGTHPGPETKGPDRERIPFWDELMAANSDIQKCGSCPKRKDHERWCDRHPRARKYHPVPAHPCIRPEVTP